MDPALDMSFPSIEGISRYLKKWGYQPTTRELSHIGFLEVGCAGMRVGGPEGRG
jgi:hypothetical protein